MGLGRRQSTAQDAGGLVKTTENGARTNSDVWPQVPSGSDQALDTPYPHRAQMGAAVSRSPNSNALGPV